MVVLKRKSRMVSFRLTEDEHDALLKTCVANGARSVSDFTRTWMCDILARNGRLGGEAVEAKVEQLRAWVQQLDGKIEYLARLTDRSSPKDRSKAAS
jgi:hypothetical protein